jgi:hypothetical protein
MFPGRPKLRARSIVHVPLKFGFVTASAITDNVIIAAAINNIFLAIAVSPF